jgi:hypothetical protein
MLIIGGGRRNHIVLSDELSVFSVFNNSVTRTVEKTTGLKPIKPCASSKHIEFGEMTKKKLVVQT